MSNAPRLRTLRSQLFTSHLLVMVVALVVLVSGVGLVVALVELLGERRALGIGPRDRNGGLGLLVGLIAATIAAALVSWRVAKRLAAPLERIGEATRELAAGRYEVRVPGADTLEVDALAEDVNGLAQELRTTEERRLRLIGDVAHELRNPLSTIEGTMEALLDGVMVADEETFARIGREAARLRRLADDLSSLSSAGDFSMVEQQPVDLGALLVGVTAQLEPQATAKGLAIELIIGAEPVVMGDGDRLTQVFMNVLGNAIQYTDQGKVTARLMSEGSQAIVEVSDTGRGLTEADQTRIFERFHRVDQQFADGTGVGLAISRLIVEAHGGAIRAESPGLAAGTTVLIELPNRS